MRVRVLFFGILRELAGTSSEELELPDGSVVRDVIEHYAARIPKLKDSRNSIAMAVNQKYSDLETRLTSEDEVALLPPVSGGAHDDHVASQDQKRVRITRQIIDTQATLDGLKQGEDGAAVIFEGIVRNHTRGRKTLYLDYEAYEGMALVEMKKLVDEALQKFRIRDVAMVHRLGRLEIGETSVLIVVASAHRGPAFDACRWLIDTLKKKVPIWKKEYFEDGSVWVDGEPFPPEIPRVNS